MYIQNLVEKDFNKVQTMFNKIYGENKDIILNNFSRDNEGNIVFGGEVLPHKTFMEVLLDAHIMNQYTSFFQYGFNSIAGPKPGPSYLMKQLKKFVRSSTLVEVYYRNINGEYKDLESYLSKRASGRTEDNRFWLKVMFNSLVKVSKFKKANLHRRDTQDQTIYYYNNIVDTSNPLTVGTINLVEQAVHNYVSKGSIEDSFEETILCEILAIYWAECVVYRFRSSASAIVPYLTKQELYCLNEQFKKVAVGVDMYDATAIAILMHNLTSDISEDLIKRI